MFRAVFGWVAMLSPQTATKPLRDGPRVICWEGEGWGLQEEADVRGHRLIFLGTILSVA